MDIRPEPMNNSFVFLGAGLAVYGLCRLWRNFSEFKDWDFETPFKYESSREDVQNITLTALGIGCFAYGVR